jgi:bla regulator protein blaR1
MIPNDFLPIANHLWQSTLFAGVAAVLTLLLKNNRAHARYCLWLAASAKFLVPFSLLMLVGGMVGRHSVVMPAPARLPVIVEQVNEPFVAEFPPAPVAIPQTSKPGIRVVPILAALWAIGCGAFVFSWCIRWRRMRLVVRAGSPVPLAIGVPVLSSPSIFEPGVFGVFRPVLLLPDGIAGRLAPAELQAIIAHELCHVRRRDNLSAMMHMIVEAVFWFHPLVWWLGTRLIAERERACDEDVLRGGNQAEAYAEGILKVCELYLQSPLECASGVTGSNLKKRIEAIMANRPKLNLNFSKKAGLVLAGLVAVATPVILGITHATELRAQAQSAPNHEISGTWQGRLPTPQASDGGLRLVLKISQADRGSLKALVYTIDRNPTPLSATSITLKGSVLKLSIEAFNATFEGTLGSDGNTITGKWTDGTAALPLTLNRPTDRTAWTIPEPPSLPAAMPADAKPDFAVATIKPSRPDAPRGGYGIRGQEVSATNVTVNWMIKLGYNVHAHQISGGPAWLDSDRYDTVGRSDTPGQPNRDQMKLMFRKLLVDRFQLRFHIERKELPVYAMVVARSGAKIAVSNGDPNDFPGIGFGRAPGVISLAGRNTGLNGVVNGLQSNILDRPVVDQTGMTGRYDFLLRFTPDPDQAASFGGVAPANTADLDAPPDIFTAFEQQLGLKLQPARAVVDVMVIDSIDRPSPN